MKIEKIIDEIKEKCASHDDSILCNGSPFRNCYDYMKENGMNSISFVLDEDFYGGVTVELSIKDNKFFISLTDNGVLNNKIAYSANCHVFNNISPTRLVYEYDLEEYKEDSLKMMLLHNNESLTIQDIRKILSNRHNCYEIGEEITVFGKEFTVTKINGANLVLSSEDLTVNCETLEYEYGELQQLIIYMEYNEGFNCSVIIYK